MNRYRKLAAAILVLSLILAGTGCQATTDWKPYVESHLKSFSGEFVSLGEGVEYPVENDVLYSFQTDDDRAISFEVFCTYGQATSPFGFSYPWRTRIVMDNFGKRICAYVSETYGTLDIGGKNKKEIAADILPIITTAEDMLTEYGVTGVSPAVTFTLLDGGEEYALTWANKSETMLLDRLGTLLPTGRLTHKTQEGQMQ